MSPRDGQAAPADEIEVAVVGAGPAGLMLANLLGQQGIRVVVFEAGSALIDYPRGVGMDDETLRTFQIAGLVDEVLPHTIPHQLLVFVDAKFRDLARLAPPSADFGWPRRNGFVQPLADRVLLEGLSRFPSVEVRWSSRVTGIAQDADRVTLTLDGPDGASVVSARYAVGADGGSSSTRKALGFAFEGTSASADWLVVDLRNDPLGRPGSYVCADPRRPYVSISIPHGIRRFEFMLKPREHESVAMTDEFVAQLLRPMVPDVVLGDILRRRVYTHHSRLAERFRSRRVLLIGDAAHVMPVWQGQGYNSGIRDSVNVAWKLTAVLRGLADAALLDSYELERRDHVKAMTDLSTWVGRAVSIRNRVGAGARNTFFRALSAVPRAKTYIVTMRFKPMPTIVAGAITRRGSSASSPVGRLFIQPTVATLTSPAVKLDDVLGPWFALIVWNNDPLSILDEDARRRLAVLGVRLVTARPAVQLRWNVPPVDDGVTIVGDLDGTLKRWFDDRQESVILVRPDRIVAGAAPAYAAADMVRGFADAMGAPAPPVRVIAPESPARTPVGAAGRGRTRKDRA